MAKNVAKLKFSPKQSVPKADFFEEIFQSNPDGILIINKEGNIVLMNPAAQTLLNRKVGEFVGGLLDLPDALAGTAEVEITDVSGQVHFVETQTVKMSSPGQGLGAGAAFMMVLRDMTERKKLEQDFKRRNLRLESDFVSTAAHEFRTPMVVIRESVSQVLEGLHGSVSESQRDTLQMSLRGIDRLNRLIDHLLDVSRIEAGKIYLKYELVNIVELAREVLEMFRERAQKNRLELKGKFSRELMEVYADRDRILQVFINLVGNALKFTPRGSVTVSVVDQDSCVECSVSDTGQGIREEDLPKIFGKFQQFGAEAVCGEKGTGLGLAISKGIVEFHGGEIHAESTWGEGSSFIFKIPRYTLKDLLRESLREEIKLPMDKQSSPPLSVVAFDLSNQGFTPQPDFKDAEVFALIEDLNRQFERMLRKNVDRVLSDHQFLMVVLPQTSKEHAEGVCVRLDRMIHDSMFEKGWDAQTRYASKVASFPDDAENEDGLISKIYPESPSKDA